MCFFSLIFEWFLDSNISLQQSFSNLALQICKLAASLTRQECKLKTSFCKRVSHHDSNLQQVSCVKHIANYSKKYADEPPTTRFLNLSSSPLSQRDFDCGRHIALQKDCSYSSYFKLSS
ncbi:hypothetical protein AVEN_190931-1 [Araneus ventricosus]|uniref:Uncharacterized protein n=1 Tax=Araneus ventricosus TaxID=182803 RepID=A0A4Y2KCB4_ARAVE|nr:hypothetical protein AVEN_190931-1 [Araneus ventricosus]